MTSPWQADADRRLLASATPPLNHATAQAALNTTAQIAYQGLPLPLLFVCEDNGLGISVPSPAGWVESALTARPELRYEVAYGDDPAEVLGVASELADWVRAQRRPAVLHLRTVRYLSHAGADVEMAYRTPQAIRADYERDPMLGTAPLARVRGERDRRGARRPTTSRRATRCASSRSRSPRSRR